MMGMNEKAMLQRVDCLWGLCCWRCELMERLTWCVTDYIVSCLLWGTCGRTFSANSNDESSLEPSTSFGHGTQLR